jgi:hypothetical protein
MIGNYQACELWQNTRYIGMALPADASGHVKPKVTTVKADAMSRKVETGERHMREAIAYYQARRGTLTRHERMKLHALSVTLRWPRSAGQVGGEDKLSPGPDYAARFRLDAGAGACPGDGVELISL